MDWPLIDDGNMSRAACSFQLSELKRFHQIVFIRSGSTIMVPKYIEPSRCHDSSLRIVGRLAGQLPMVAEALSDSNGREHFETRC